MARRLPWVLATLVAAAAAAVGASLLLARPQSRAAAIGHVEQATHELASASIFLHTPDGVVRTDAEAVGLRVDRAASLAAARQESWWNRMVPGPPPIVARVSTTKVSHIVAVHDPSTRRAPIEPTIAVAHGKLVVRPGRAGHGLDATAVAAAVVSAARHATTVINTDVEAVRLPPRFSRSDAAALLASARSATARPLAVDAAGTAAEVPTRTLRHWLRAEATPSGLRLAVDTEAAVHDLRRLLPGAGEQPVDAGVEIVDDAAVITPAVDGTSCCAAAAGPTIAAALRHRGALPIDLPLRHQPANRTTDEVQALGITEVIGSFTTRHPAHQARVTNIHRIADLVRGVIIEPGETFSVNGFVGKRTVEKGFVGGHAIEEGKFVESVGGGISQFATTLFNAAFFAGLDIPEYQSHSIWIHRYPRGREATLSWPKPDLVVRNSTPHGVLIWPTYTGSSLTVSLWSTPFVTGEQTGQTETKVGNCTRVRTERTRHYLDGRTKVDAVFATYRPAEGVNC